MATKDKQTLSGQLVDVHQRSTYPAEITIEGSYISSIKPVSQAPDVFIMPGFIDAHIHIESSMLPPASFASVAVKHGTVATVSDPHEIANVCGVPGIQYMIDHAATVPFHFFFGAPSCVPATGFETSGAALDEHVVELLLRDKNIWYLSEVMNYPAVLNREKWVMQMIKAARRYGKPVDGHAPGLMGMDAKVYASAGISTDHECTSLPEALDKIAGKMKILIREGSAAKNFEALHPLIGSHPGQVMFCCDDKHPDELMQDHINHHVRRSLALGYNLYDVLNIACVHPVVHYQLPVGLLRAGDSADFIVVENLESFKVLRNMIKGQWVVENGQSLIPFVTPPLINNFEAQAIHATDLTVHSDEGITSVHCIVAQDGQLLTDKMVVPLLSIDGVVHPSIDEDILKIVVINRYEKKAAPAIGFIKGFGLKAGAIASSVAHDSHNIIAVGTNDTDITNAVNALITNKGGLSCVQGDEQQVMPLRIAGLMHDEAPEIVAASYQLLDQAAKQLGSTLAAPYMTLSFMALLVIPSLKMSDLGLFDGQIFTFQPLMEPH